MLPVTAPASGSPASASPDVVADASVSPSMPDAPRPRRDALRIALILAAVLLACVLVYLATAAPGRWFPRASPKAWSASDLTVVRGAGALVGGQLVITASDANGIALVNVTTDLASTDYPGIEWDVSGLAEDADARLLWRSDFQPDRVNNVPLRIEAGRTVATVMAGNPAWIGHVTGLALAIRGTLAQPAVIHGVTAKPMGVIGIARDRLHDWLAFERWNGASINTIAGGADYQPLPLPLLLALVVGLSGLAVVALRRLRPGAFTVPLPAIMAAFFLAGWLLLDMRWSWNLIRQERETATRYAGKDAHDKRLANEDGQLYAFIEKSLAVMPPSPVRVFVASDTDYFRGRAAYHLYPHRVYFDPRSSALPPAGDMHAGDWLLVYRQHGIQFDRGQGKVRWDGNQIVGAELKLVEPGAALFLIR
jgi:hypothetical protein